MNRIVGCQTFLVLIVLYVSTFTTIGKQNHSSLQEYSIIRW